MTLRDRRASLVANATRGFGLVVLLGLGVLVSCAPPEAEIPTWTMEPTAFEHRITAEGKLKAAVSTPISVPPQVRRRVRLAWLAEDGARVEEGEIVARFDPQEMEDRLRVGEADLRSAELKARKADLQNRSRLTDLESDHDIADLELEHARKFRKTDAGIFSRHEILEEEIDEELAERRKENAAGARSTQEALGRAEVEIQEIEKRKAVLQIDQAREGLEALEVRAPHAGVLTITRDWRGNPLQVGTDLWRGQELGQIPDLEKLEAEVYVLEADAGGLAVGQKARVIVEAHPEIVHEATIKHVDAAAQPRFRGSPVQYFGVVLELTPVEGARMKPGQRVRASLELADLDDALVVPRQAIFQDDGQARVFRRRGDGFEPRAVELGITGRGLAVVESGLDAGDEIALKRPPAADDGVGVDVADEASNEEDEHGNS